MKNHLFVLAVLGLMAGSAQGGVVLSTDHAPPTPPLNMSAGTISGPMLLNVASSDFPNDVMSAWNVQLEIIPIAATGTLTFQDPATALPPSPPSPHPADYIFGGDGLGIAVTNLGTVLSANDFYDPSFGSGINVPTSGANLLQMTFLASLDASGLFGIYADRGLAATIWTDASSNPPQFFTNVPDGSGTVLIGEVQISAPPEPSTLGPLTLCGVTLLAWQLRRSRHRSATSTE
jgi:hypothetical protein